MTLRSPCCVPEFPRRFERSEAVERLERLERARVRGKRPFQREKAAAKPLKDAYFAKLL
jgi:hypothetical protein